MRNARWIGLIAATAAAVGFAAKSVATASETTEMSVDVCGDNICTADMHADDDDGLKTLQQQDSAKLTAFEAASPAMIRMSRKVAHKFIAREQGEGAGARVRRSIGSYKLKNIDPFLMLDEFNVGLPGGFPDHPHRGFETVTYVLPTSKGRMLHEDFLGNKGELGPGDLQWMTPGRGIVHAEMPATTEPAHGLQLWINLPKSSKMMDPRYQEVSRNTVPHVFDDDKKVEAIVFAGEVFGQKGPIQTEAPVTYIHFIMQKDAKLEYNVPIGHHAFVYTLAGNGMCAGQNITSHEAVVMEQEGDGIVFMTGPTEGVEFIVISGQPLNEPIVQYGPFVMTTRDEIREAFDDYQLGVNGFEKAPTWESEISHLSDDF